MPEHIRALVVILILAGTTFALARGPTSGLVAATDFSRRRNTWFALTLTAFLAHNFWIYLAIAALVLVTSGEREQNPVALFFLTLFALPPAGAEIPGLGLVNYILELNHLRLLSLIILFPAFIMLRRSEGTRAFGSIRADWILGTFLVLTVVLQLRDTTSTDTLRQLVYAFLDVFLPYYVTSRALQDIAGFRDALLAFVLAAMLTAAIGVFETVRSWYLYNAVVASLGLTWGYSGYLFRAGILRASASTGHSIALGYVITVAIGCYVYLKQYISSALNRWLGGLLLAGGLIATLSRGPWIGLAFLMITYLASGRFAIRRLAIVAAAGIVALPLLAVVPSGDKVLDLLPFIGTVEKGNIDYRQRLFDNALVVIERNPWLGSVNYREAAEMQAMRQGQGIIDIVNTYVGVALEFGFVGLALFLGFFASVVLGIFRAMLALADRDSEIYRLGQALLATLVSILVILATVSSITVIPIVYWSMAGLGVAYAQMVRRHVQSGDVGPSGPRHAEQ